MFKNKVSSKYTFTQMTLEEPDRDGKTKGVEMMVQKNYDYLNRN